jgi:hypothetical protein
MLLLPRKPFCSFDSILKVQEFWELSVRDLKKKKTRKCHNCPGTAAPFATGASIEFMY